MLYWIYEWWKAAFEAEKLRGVQEWAHTFSFLNLLGYITFRAAVACLLAFVVSLMAGPRVIRRLI
jgi:phospho-N-acetylmuramoyl-pentapeptide-transferase